MVYNLSTNRFEGTVPGLSNASAFVYDSANRSLYACDPRTDSVEVFDPDTRVVIRESIPVGENPDAITYDPANQYVFVANAGSDNVTVINAHTNRIVDAGVPTGKTPVNLVAVASSNRVFVANANSTYLSVVNATVPTTIENTIPLLQGDAFGLAYSEGTGVVAVTSPESRDMTIIQAATGDVVTSLVPSGTDSYEIVASSNGSTFIVANRSGGDLTFVSASSYAVSPDLVNVGGFPTELTSIPNTPFVISWSSTERDLAFVNVSTKTLVSSSQTLGPSPNLVVGAPGAGLVYVGSPTYPAVEALNLSTGFEFAVGPSIGTAPLAFAFDNLTHTLYIANSGAVLAVDGATDRILVQNAALPGENGPLCLDSQAGIIWVGRSSENEVVALSVSSLQPLVNTSGMIVRDLEVEPLSPQAMVFDPQDSDVFAINSSTNAITIFDVSSGQIVARNIPAGQNLTSLTYDSVDGLVYAAGSDLVALNPSTLKPAGAPLVLPEHSGNVGLAFDASRDLIYVSTTSSTTGLGTLTIVSGSSSDALSGPAISVPDGKGPVDLSVYSPLRPDLNESDIILSANSLAGTIGMIGSPPVVASFTLSPSSIDVGQTTQAILVASGGAGVSSVSFSGLPEGCTTKDTFHLSCAPSTSGTFEIHASLMDSLGEYANATAYLNVGTSIGLSAVFGSFSTPEADVGIPFNATATAIGGTPPYNYSWSFGDGSTAVGRNVTHSFTAPGSFPVVVEVSDRAGATAFQGSSVQVFPTPIANPAAAPGATTDVGLPLELNGNVLGGATPGQGSWTFGDGDFATGVDVSHVWEAKGEYDAHFTYVDALGIHANRTTSIGVPIEVDPVLTGSFSATPSSAPAVPGTIFHFVASLQGGTPGYSVTWSFGGGSYASGPEANASFSGSGTFTVGVLATDAVGAQLVSSVVVTVVPASHTSPSIVSGNFGPGLALGLFLGAVVAAIVLFTAERSRRRALPGPPSPYVPPPPARGPGKRT